MKGIFINNVTILDNDTQKYFIGICSAGFPNWTKNKALAKKFRPSEARIQIAHLKTRYVSYIRLSRE